MYHPVLNSLKYPEKNSGHFNYKKNSVNSPRLELMFDPTDSPVASSHVGRVKKRWWRLVHIREFDLMSLVFNAQSEI